MAVRLVILGSGLPVIIRTGERRGYGAVQRLDSSTPHRLLRALVVTPGDPRAAAPLHDAG
jgi:hypothetical protein